MEEECVIDLSEVSANMLKSRFTMENLFGGMMYRTMSQDDVYARFMDARTHMARILMISDHFPFEEFQNIVNAIHSLLTKNTKIANVLKKKAEAYRNSSNIPDALRAYNLALLFTPRGNSGLIAELLEQRAILRLAINDKKGALRDTITTSAFDPELESLLNFSALSDEVTRDELCRIRNDADREHLDNVMFKVPGDVGPDCCTIGNFVSIETDGEIGLLSVTQDLRPGTTVIVEDPYVTVLDDALKWDDKHCARCFKEINGGMECPNCVFVMYCGLTCQQEDLARGHQYECACYPYLHSIRASRSLHLALKAVCKTGPENLYTLFLASGNSESEFSDEAEFSFPTTCEANTYHRILKLKYHVEHADLPNSSWLAVSITHILEYNTTFFDLSLDEGIEKKEFCQFVASVILHHELGFEYNARLIYKQSESVDAVGHFSRNKFQEERIGCGVYPIVTLVNHSCVPNLMTKQLLNGRMALITTKKLFCGDELLDSYGYDFLGQSLEERKVGIIMNHGFTCKCLACTHNWPEYSELEPDLKFICQNCGIRPYELSYTDILKCVLVEEGDISTCNVCKRMFSTHLMKEEVARYKEIVAKVEKRVKRKIPCTGINALIGCIEFFQKVLLFPSVEMISSQILLGEAYQVIIENSSGSD